MWILHGGRRYDYTSLSEGLSARAMQDGWTYMDAACPESVWQRHWNAVWDHCRSEARVALADYESEVLPDAV